VNFNISALQRRVFYFGEIEDFLNQGIQVLYFLKIEKIKKPHSKHGFLRRGGEPPPPRIRAYFSIKSLRFLKTKNRFTKM